MIKNFNTLNTEQVFDKLIREDSIKNFLNEA